MPVVDDMLGRELGGRYRIRARLGAGASAAVYLAEDERLDRQVAVKVLHAGLAGESGFVRRFQGEARAAARLRHPHIVQVYDWGEEPLYVVLEYLAGGSLRQLLDRNGPLQGGQVVALGAAAAEGLAHAHQRGTAHRDIKPANLLFDEEGRLAIADFGIARAMADATWTEPEGVILGTARYASPEQATGHPTGPPTDVYSLALVLVEALTGAVPFSADTTVATLMARQGRRVEPTRELGPLGPLVAAATDPDPAARPDSAWLAHQLGDLARKLPRPAPLPLYPPLAGEGGAASGAVSGAVGAAPSGGAGVEEIPWPLPVRPTADETVVVAAIPPQPAPDMALTAVSVAPGAGAGGVAGVAGAAGPGSVGVGAAAGPAAEGRTGRRRRVLLVLALVLVLALLGAGLYVAIARLKVLVPNRPVPAVAGQALARAEAAVTAAHLLYRVEPARYSATVPVGDVLSESPAGGTAKQGSTVLLTPSKGLAPRAVPSLSGLSQAAAGAKLTQAGFKPQFTGAYSETVQSGVVVSWSPDSGEQAAGTTVAVTVSKGPQPRIVSDVSGDTYAQAQAALANEQLNATEAQVYSSTVPVGQVVSTSPAAGQPAARGSTVTVNISQGPQMVQVPDVDGMDVTDATAAIQAAGLVVSNVYGPPNRPVFVTDPTAGTTVQAGSGVDLYTG